MKILAKKYVLLDSLIFKIGKKLRKRNYYWLFQKHADKIMSLYHLCLFGGHKGVVKTYLTLGDKFFIPGQIYLLRSYRKACYICQLSRNEKPLVGQLPQRINLNYRLLSRLSMDLKVKPG